MKLTKNLWRIPVEHASAFLYFHKKGIVQELIHNLKYKGHEDIGTLLDTGTPKI
jgi:predicted amidophosphoribosyltransferase